MNKRVEVLKLKTRQDGVLIVSFLVDSKKMELENAEFEKSFGSVEQYIIKGVEFVG